MRPKPNLPSIRADFAVDDLAGVIRQLIDTAVAEALAEQLDPVTGPSVGREFISRREAARLLGVRTSRINELLRDGELLLILEGTHGKLSRRNVNAYLELLAEGPCNFRPRSGSSRDPRYG